MLESKSLAQLVAKLAIDKKGKFPVIMEVGQRSSVADYFVIVSGTSVVGLRAMADHIDEQLKEQGVPMARLEGYHDGQWILMDYGIVVVHLFHDETRQFYALERLWSDTPTTNVVDGVDK